MNGLGIEYLALGRYDRAELLFQEAVDGSRKKLTLAHSQTQKFIRDMVDCSEKMGKPGRAEPILREVADFWKEKDGADSPRYAGELAYLGLNLLHQKRGADAEAVLLVSLKIRQEKEPDAWKTFNTQSLLGSTAPSEEIRRCRAAAGTRLPGDEATRGGDSTGVTAVSGTSLREARTTL